MRLGKDGWEVVSLLPLAENGHGITVGFMCVLNASVPQDR
jgi:hypothetical protein